MALLDEVRKGRMQGLEALRDMLAGELDGCDSSRDVAALSLRLVGVLEQIECLAPQQPSRVKSDSAVDEFTARRRGRAAGA